MTLEHVWDEAAMDGREAALGTLHRQQVGYPSINYSWITHSRFLTHLAGRDFWSDPLGVFVQYIRRCGINLVPQWYIPGEQHRRLEAGELMHEPNRHEAEGFHSPEDVVRAIEQLPCDQAVERDFDVEAEARSYADTIRQHTQLLGRHTLVIDGFGQADFMGGYERWGYENYLQAAALYPEALKRYYWHSALRGRLRNHAIALAVERYGIAPFVYGGQDICTSGGPIMSPTMLRELYFPALKRCLEPLLEAGVGIIWHCDGDIRPIVSDLMDLGVIGLQGFEEEHGPCWEEMVQLRDSAGQLIAVWGCVSVTTTLPRGSAAEVRAAVERSFIVAGRGRGHVLSATSSIMPETPIENIEAFFHYGHRFGREFLGG